MSYGVTSAGFVIKRLATILTDLRDAVKGAFGRIDICVNSAGINVRKPALDMSPDEFRRVLGVNLTGSWIVARAAGAVMVEQGRGKVINLASIYAHVAIDGLGKARLAAEAEHLSLDASAKEPALTRATLEAAGGGVRLSLRPWTAHVVVLRLEGDAP